MLSVCFFLCTGIIKGKEYFHCGAKEKGLMVPIGDIKHI